MKPTVLTNQPTRHRWPSLGQPVAPAPSAPGERPFGYLVGGVLLAAAAFSAWRGHALRAELAAGVGAVLVIAAAVRPAWLSRPASWWMRLAGLLGWFNSRVLMTLVFAVVFTPFGVVTRAIGMDPLGRRRRLGSHWSAYPERFRDTRHYERLY
jgi:hypothetical protein